MPYYVHPHDPKQQMELDIKHIDKFLPPHGRHMLTFSDDAACGIGCLKSINAETGEIKRMYGNPSFRKIGARRALLQPLIVAAKATGNKHIRLDSPKFMEAAHALYRKAGFKDIPVYPEVEIPEEFRGYLLYIAFEVG